MRHKIIRSFVAIIILALSIGKMAYAQEQEYLIAIGIIKTDSTVKLQEFRKLMLPIGTDDEPGIGSYSIELQDVNGILLFGRYFELRDVSGGSETRPFFEKIPYHPSTKRIVLKYGETILKTLIVSENKPDVKVTYPNGGGSLSGKQYITWTATDPDGDTLSYDILYSKDGGNSWSAIAIGIKQQKYLWDTNGTPGSNQALIRVLATDGVNTGQDDSDSSFTVTKKFPQIVISTPTNNAVYILGEPIIFTGHGFDFEDGPLGNNKLTWASNIDGVIGSGSNIVLRTLSSGTHIITLSADDSDGNHGTANVMINISSMQDSDGDRVGDDVDNCPKSYNPDQADFDGDGLGDVCDDSDGDGFPDSVDNCRLIPNNQTDSDNDRLGDACDIPGELDTTPPTLYIKLSPLPNSLGWHSTNVTARFICSDFESGISICPAPTVVSNEGVGILVTRTAVDQGSNTSSNSVTINLDKTPPVINTSFSKLPNAGGWYNSDVTAIFNCYDTGSGISSCPESVTVTTEDAEQIITGTAFDLAGNSRSKSVTVNLDKTPPTITSSLSSPPNVFGWYNSDVVVTFTCSDTLSGISACPDPVTITTEGAGQIATGTAVDVAGNSASTSVTINLDKTSPIITCPLDTEILAMELTGTSSSNNRIQSFLTSTSASDNLTPAVSITNNASSLFPLGQTIVTFAATDNAGNKSDCQSRVNVISPIANSNGSSSYFSEGGYNAYATFDVKYMSGSPSGNLTFSSTKTRRKVVSTGITLLMVIGKAAVFAGPCTLNGVSGYNFTATVGDNATPGAGKDTFAITVTGPNGFSYSASGTIISGEYNVSQ